MGVRLTASLQADHSAAVELGAVPVPLVGPVYLRVVVPIDEDGTQPEAIWPAGGESTVVPWWSGDGRQIGWFLNAPAPVDVQDGTVVSVSVAGEILTGLIGQPPEPEPEPRHPLASALLAAGASDRLADLVERRLGGDLLTNAEGAELLANLGDVRFADLETETALALGDVVAAVTAKQRADASLLEVVRGLTGG